jgi:hypothetical protein
MSGLEENIWHPGGGWVEKLPRAIILPKSIISDMPPVSEPQIIYDRHGRPMNKPEDSSEYPAQGLDGSEQV